MGNWIGKLKKGGLHESLGVPMGQDIPSEKFSQALKGKKGPLARKQANAAKTLAKLRPR